MGQTNLSAYWTINTMENQKSPQIIHFLPASFDAHIICLRLQIYMNYYCGPISAAKLSDSSDKWEVSVINMNISRSIFIYWDKGLAQENLESLISSLPRFHPSPHPWFLANKVLAKREAK